MINLTGAKTAGRMGGSVFSEKNATKNKEHRMEHRAEHRSEKSVYIHGHYYTPTYERVGIMMPSVPAPIHITSMYPVYVSDGFAVTFLVMLVMAAAILRMVRK